MASTKEYKDYILDELKILDDITCKPMMGEYLLYYHNTLFGGIYDDIFLVKITDNNQKYHLKEVIPYPNAKPMFWVDDVDNPELLKEIVINTYNISIERLFANNFLFFDFF